METVTRILLVNLILKKKAGIPLLLQDITQPNAVTKFENPLNKGIPEPDFFGTSFFAGMQRYFLFHPICI